MNKQTFYIIASVVLFFAIVCASYWLGFEVGKHNNVIEEVLKFCPEEFYINITNDSKYYDTLTKIP